MCGILSVVSFKGNITGSQLAKASSVIRHRGPDDEGFLTWQPGDEPQVWAGDDTSEPTLRHWKYLPLPGDKRFMIGMGHRRLSILDLSPGGHQPMIHEKAGLAVCFNGEIYNYLEIKAELQSLGHQFVTTSDTEVILHAWEEWGHDCLNDFNGMFAFTLLDYHENKFYVVRDRFGVKPVYYYRFGDSMYIGSEIKQLRTAPGYQFQLNTPVARQFLATGAAEHTTGTFDTQIHHLPGGHYMTIDLAAPELQPVIEPWYILHPKPFHGSEEEAAHKLRELLTSAVDLRLRSDVKVGSALSGGLDSSSIVCLMAELLHDRGDHSGQETVTACYENARFDEWNFAQEVIKRTNAHPHRTFPTFGQLREEFDSFLWHQDEPVASTSVFSQWRVFRASHEAGLKVMIDGQGADEQLAGYGGNDLALYADLLGHRHFLDLWHEAKAYRKEKGHWPIGFLLGAWKIVRGRTFPVTNIDWMQGAEPATIHPQPAHNLRDNLLRQLYGEPLPALLRYEDHNSMAWSVESRTPFMDYRLVEFNLGLPPRFVYRNGERKHVLRKSMHGVLPPAIEHRKDKMGFVTPEELWLREEGREWFSAGIDDSIQTIGDGLINRDATRAHVQEIISGTRKFSFMPWRVLCFGKWMRMVQ